MTRPTGAINEVHEEDAVEARTPPFTLDLEQARRLHIEY